MAASRHTFFYSDSHFCSQWYPCKFNIEGITFNSAEQWMMYSKAKLFKDKESATKILKSTSPREQKALGRRVKNFEERAWDRYAKAIVFIGNLAKFSQNSELFDQLKNTVDTTLVEASPYDTIWGIGLKWDNPKIQDETFWRGRNWLGYILTILRDIMISDETYRLNSGEFRKLTDVPESLSEL